MKYHDSLHFLYYTLLREGRNHEIWFNPDTRKEFQIPRHRSKELPTGTANNILKAAGIYKTI